MSKKKNLKRNVYTKNENMRNECDSLTATHKITLDGLICF